MGQTQLRREFDLPSDDTEHLTARGLPWETLMDGGAQWLLIHEFPVPDAYTHSRTTAAIRIESGYPTAQLDMVYFHQPLSLKNGKVIGAISPQTIDGKEYQRWSRHRTGPNPWRPGLDDVSSHLALVEEWLLKEADRE